MLVKFYLIKSWNEHALLNVFIKETTTSYKWIEEIIMRRNEFKESVETQYEH